MKFWFQNTCTPDREVGSQLSTSYLLEIMSELAPIRLCNIKIKYLVVINCCINALLSTAIKSVFICMFQMDMKSVGSFYYENFVSFNCYFCIQFSYFFQQRKVFPSPTSSTR